MRASFKGFLPGKRGDDDVGAMAVARRDRLRPGKGRAGPHRVGPRLARADIVVDQLNSGWYGLFAIEAMAYGKPVVGHIRERAAARTAAAFGAEVPIVRTTKETLAADLRPLLDSAEECQARAGASRAYVERVHDADKMADRLLAIYADL